MEVQPQYVVKDYVISQSTLNKNVFGFLKNRRRIANGTVRNICQQLEQGVHFDSPIVVNKVGSEYYVIDGNHRVEAIKKFLKANPESSIRVRLSVYENLTTSEEKDIYTRWNKGRKQTTNDVVQQYKEDLRLFKWLENTNPGIDVYGSSGNLSFFRVVGGYLAAKSKEFRGGYIGSAFDFIEEAQELSTKDADVIKAFLADYYAAFGANTGNKNSWYKTTPFTAIFKLWYDNRDSMTPDVMQKALMRLDNGDKTLTSVHSQSGASSCVNAYILYRTAINYNRKKNIFV